MEFKNIITIKVDDKLKKLIKKLCEKKGVERSSLIRIAITEYIEKNKKLLEE